MVKKKPHPFLEDIDVPESGPYHIYSATAKWTGVNHGAKSVDIGYKRFSLMCPTIAYYDRVCKSEDKFNSDFEYGKDVTKAVLAELQRDSSYDSDWDYEYLEYASFDGVNVPHGLCDVPATEGERW